MTIPEIANTIKALKKESRRIQATDQNSTEAIDLLINKLDEQLVQPLGDDHQSLVDQLQTAVESLEAEHPKITALINDLSVKLAAIGI